VSDRLDESNKLDELAVRLVREVKGAILETADDLAAQGLQVRQVDLELKTRLARQFGGALRVKIIELSGQVAKEEVQTIMISLVPRPEALRLMGPVSEELRESVEVISSAVREAAQSAPIFDLDSASVSLEVGVERSGKVSVFLEGSGKRGNTHTITLTLASA
jgi:hypothetical protein